MVWHMRGSSLLAALAMVLPLLSYAGQARAERYALLVGVSEYRDSSWEKLPGTGNDIAALYLALRNRGFAAANISVLADRIGVGGEGIQPKGPATRQAILDAFDHLAATVHAGDQLFLLLAGHGDKQPKTAASPTTNPDATEEVFIPIDAGSPVEGKSIPNGIPGYEIGRFLNRLRAAGAEAWLVVDTCHSGGLSRGLTPAAMFSKPADEARPELGGGRVVVFMSAQKDQTVKEVTFPVGGKPVSYGPLSLLVAQILMSEGDFTYAEAAQRVKAGFGVSPYNVAFQSTPLFEGELERPVFPGTERPAVPTRWPAAYNVPDIRIEAGRLHGLQPGQEILLWGNSPERARQGLPLQPVARATIYRTDLLESFATLVPQDARLTATDLIAEPAQPIPPLRIRIASPAGATRPDWLAAFAARLSGDQRFILVPYGAEAEYRLATTQAGIWAVPQDSAVEDFAAIGGEAIPLTDPANSIAARLLDIFQQYARAEQLLRVVKDPSEIRATRALKIDLRLLRASPSPAGSPPARCPRVADTAPEGATPVSPEAIPDLRHCDTLYLSIRNTGRYILDLGLCSVDGVGRVATADMLTDLRLQPGKTYPQIALSAESWDYDARRPSAGRQRLFIMAVERRKEDPTALSYHLPVSASVCPHTLSTADAAVDRASIDERRRLDGISGTGGTSRAVGGTPTLDGTIAVLLQWNQLLAP